MEAEVKRILEENKRRWDEINTPFNPLTGEGSIGPRVHLHVEDYPEFPDLYLPEEMVSSEPIIRVLAGTGSLQRTWETISHDNTTALGATWCEEYRDNLIEYIFRLRIYYDFPFWAFCTVTITNKGGGDDIRFRLNRQQRILASVFERQRLAGRCIRVVLAKSRQWGGSTLTQIYMAWIQLVRVPGINSVIIGHISTSSSEVMDMFKRVISSYPVKLLHPFGAYTSSTEKKIENVGRNILRVPQRNCKIKLGSAQTPDSARGGDSALVHLTEVAFFRKTEGKKPSDIVRSACAGSQPQNTNSMQVYESSPNGSKNFFHKEYLAAKNHETIFEAVFVAWWQNEKLFIPFQTEADKESFARWLYQNRRQDYAPDNRHEPGTYLWYLYKTGATLEGIAWYIQQRTTYFDHADIAAEYPTDDIEAFTYSGMKVFDDRLVEQLRPGCMPPRWTGELEADGMYGDKALQGIHFVPDSSGRLSVWDKPEVSLHERVTDRYLVVVDIGGQWAKADWSVIAVFDRLNMIDGGEPILVAQWYGHIDMDLLAWKAAQIAAWYDDALLVIESNTIETKDPNRIVDGDQSYTVLNEISEYYDNLYARRTPEDAIRTGRPVRYGFQTNVSTKPKIISVLKRVIREKLYVERDERCLDEYKTYERKPSGANVYGAMDGYHDDLLMTRAIGMQVCFYELPVPAIVSRNTDTLRNQITKQTVGSSIF